jgi:hypothetical protein
MIKEGTRITDDQPRTPLIGQYKLRQDVVRVSKRIVRRLGHLMPKGAWLETFSYPGSKLTARCRHCSRIFVLSGRPDVGQGKWKVAPQYTTSDEPGFIARFELDPWIMFEVISNAAEIETSTAFQSGRAATSSERITDVGPRDWELNAFQRSFHTLVQLAGGTPPTFEDESLDEETKEARLIEKKLKPIDKRFYCAKVKTWL